MKPPPHHYKGTRCQQMVPTLVTKNVSVSFCQFRSPDSVRSALSGPAEGNVAFGRVSSQMSSCTNKHLSRSDFSVAELICTASPPDKNLAERFSSQAASQPVIPLYPSGTDCRATCDTTCSMHCSLKAFLGLQFNIYLKHEANSFNGGRTVSY